jgi:hypothetical protein
VEKGLAGVRSGPGDHVQGDPIEHLADRLVGLGLLGQPPRNADGQLAAQQVRWVDAADDQQRRPVVHLAATHRQQVDFPVPPRTPQRLECGVLRLGDRFKLQAIRVVAGVSLDGRLVGQRRLRQQPQTDGNTHKARQNTAAHVTLHGGCLPEQRIIVADFDHSFRLLPAKAVPPFLRPSAFVRPLRWDLL